MNEVVKKFVPNMNELATRILKNRKHMEQTLSETVPYVEVIMAEKPLSITPRKPLKPLPWIIHADPIDATFLLERLSDYKAKAQLLTLKHHLHFESDGRNFKKTDEFQVPSKILPAHILEKISKGNDEVDITEEINRELSALDKDKM